MEVRSWRRIFASLVIGIALFIGSAVPGAAQADDTGWRGEYYDNPDLQGAADLIRVDRAIDFNWGGASPHPSIPADGFSVRWSRTIYFAAATYEFSTRTDDGVRLYLDGRLILDRWVLQSATTHTTQQRLSAGLHTVTMEYFENTGGALASLSWSQIDPPATDAWRGEYYNNRTLSGAPTLVREDARIDFDWGQGSPDPRISADTFSVRWTRQVRFTQGTYRFTTRTDDGVRLFIDGRLILDEWVAQPPTTHSVDHQLATGPHTVTMEYFENTGGAVASLSWTQIAPGTDSTAWRGEYYANRFLSGSPALARDDPDIAFDWGSGSPAPSIPSDNFSVRWTRSLYFDEATYRFTTFTDDGVRLYVDGQLVIDQWVDQSATTHDANVPMTAGWHIVVMEYYEHLGQASAYLFWTEIDEEEPGEISEAWYGEYFDNRFLSGPPTLVRQDPEIDFNWGEGSPHPAIPANNFSVRWTRRLSLDPGRYEFATTTDDGVRLYLDDTLLIDEWRDMGATTFTARAQLSEGAHTVRMEYYEHLGGAVARLAYRQVDVEAAGNLITCVGRRDSWVKVYQRTPAGTWLDLNPEGWGPIDVTGYLKIDALPVDYDRYGDEGHPYKVELYVMGRLTRQVGNIDIGQPVFRIRPFQDNYTPWQCPLL